MILISGGSTHYPSTECFAATQVVKAETSIRIYHGRWALLDSNNIDTHVPTMGQTKSRYRGCQGGWVKINWQKAVGWIFRY